MTRAERAAQIWPLLCYCAMHRQTLSYDLLSRLIGVPRVGLGQLLEPIQSFCIINDLPPLTSIVVSQDTGIPGEGFIAAADVPRAHEQVFAFDWLNARVPSPDELEDAAKQLPSSSRPLHQLLQEVGRGKQER